MSEPRIQPLSDDAFAGEARAIALRYLPEQQCDLNLVRTFAHSPAALDGFLHWARYFLSDRNSLPPREREIVVLRIAHLCKSAYELAQHVSISRDAGLSADEFERVARGADAGWNDADAALIRACDDLVSHQVVSDAVWQQLSRAFSVRQTVDVVMTAAQYVQLAMMLNSFKVQVEA